MAIDEDLGVRGAGGAQQFRARGIAVVDRVAEAAHEIDLFGVGFQRDERDLLRHQQARDDLSEATEAGEDHLRIAVRDRVEVALRLRRRPQPDQAIDGDHQQRRQRHRQADDRHQAIAHRHVEQSGA